MQAVEDGIASLQKQVQAILERFERTDRERARTERRTAVTSWRQRTLQSFEIQGLPPPPPPGALGENEESLA